MKVRIQNFCKEGGEHNFADVTQRNRISEGNLGQNIRGQREGGGYNLSPPPRSALEGKQPLSLPKPSYHSITSNHMSVELLYKRNTNRIHNANICQRFILVSIYGIWRIQDQDKRKCVHVVGYLLPKVRF